MIAIEHYFHVTLFIILWSVDEILKWYHSSES